MAKASVTLDPAAGCSVSATSVIVRCRPTTPASGAAGSACAALIPNTATTVTIAFAGLTTTNGKPDPAEDSASKYQYTGGTFTLTTSAQGWVISDADPSPGWDEGLTSGTKYKEGC